MMNETITNLNQMKVGATYRILEVGGCDYVRLGESYRCESKEKRSAYLRNVERGSGTSVSRVDFLRFQKPLRLQEVQAVRYPRWIQQYSGEDFDRAQRLAFELTEEDRKNGRPAPAHGYSAARFVEAQDAVMAALRVHACGATCAEMQAVRS